MSDVEPWVQTLNKQLWIDSVCINPKLETQVTQRGNAVSNQQILLFNQVLVQNNNQCVNTLTFDIDEFIGRLHTSGALGNFVLRQNIGTQNVSDRVLYSPFQYVTNRDETNCITLGSHISFTGTHNEFNSEYIHSVYIATGATLISTLTQAGVSTTGIETAHDYLVIQSTFGNYNYVDIDALTGGSGGSAATVQLTASIDANDNLISDPLAITEEAYTAKLTVSSDPSSPVYLKHEPVDSVSGDGTDLRFTHTISLNDLKLRLLVIDGGEITVSNGGGSEEPNQGEQ